MSSMVNEVEYNVGDCMQTSHLIYFTNQQALGVSQQQMPSVRQALHMQEPKLVIRLLPSTGPIYWESKAGLHGREGSSAPTRKTPEISSGQALQSEHRLLLLAQEVLLPLAFRSSALIIGSSRCSLTNAFAKASAPAQRRLGENCPFRMVIYDHAPGLWKDASPGGQGLANLAWQSSDAWKRADFQSGLRHHYGCESKFWPQHNLVEGAAAYLVFESLQADGMLDNRAGEQFMNRFVASLQSHLPVVALWTYGHGRLINLGQAADHVSYRLPLILLDSRSHWTFEEELLDEEEPELVASVKSEATQCLNKELVWLSQRFRRISDALAEKTLVDTYTVSAIARVRYALDRARDVRRLSVAQNTEVRCKSFLQLWLGEAIEKARLEQDSNSQFYEHDPNVFKAVEMYLRYAGLQQSRESKIFRDMLEDAVASLLQAQDFEDLQETWLAQRHKLAFLLAHRPSCLFDKAVNGVPLLSFTEEAGVFTSDIALNLKELQESTSIDEVMESLRSALHNILTDNANYDSLHMDEEVFCRDRNLWLATRDILTSDVVHSCGIDNVDEIRSLINEQAKTERLPSHSSLQGLLLLRCAWNLCDLFGYTAKTYKWRTKISYALIMVLAAVVVGITCFEAVGSLEAETGKVLVLTLALTTGALKSWTSVTNPMNKWLKLRSGSVMLQAEIWKFRTRVGSYASSKQTSYHMNGERAAERNLHDMIRAVRGTVLESSALSQTSFYAHATVSIDAERLMDKDMTHYQVIAKHGQYRGRQSHPEVPGGGDNHHSPASPEDYISWRVEPMLHFYQSRVPFYSRLLLTLQLISIGSSILTGVLALVNLTSWTPLVVAVAGGFAAWQEFGATGKKLQRYATAIDTLSSLILWWQSLPPVDKADTRNIEHLVNAAEATVASEHTAWLSDALKAQRLMEQTMRNRHEDDDSTPLNASYRKHT
ncbi:unnamed protein product [Effrenium voratum]|nr:unnamed protein product [Effrenium voratum]